MKAVLLPDPVKTSRRTVWLLIGLALAAGAVGVHEWQAPPPSPFDGHAGWLRDWTKALAGPLAPACAAFASAVAALSAGRQVWRRAPKRPCDRLLF